MGRDEDRAAVLTWLAADLAADRDEAVTTQLIVDRAVAMIEGATYASLTVRARGRFTTLACTSDLSRWADAQQYELGQGPCVDSSEQGEWYRSGDLRSDARWPRWGPVAAERGLHSVLSIRLLSSGRPFGALNLYADQSGVFADPDVVELALLFTIHATNALTAAQHVTHLHTAMSSRHDIGVAQGILMGRYDLSATVAFAALRRVSQDANIKLSQLAQQVIETGRLPESEDLLPTDRR